MSEILRKIHENVVLGDRSGVEALVAQALEDGVPAEQVLKEALIPAMGVVGDKFEKGELYVPEMLVSARAMKAGLAQIKPALAGQVSLTLGTVVMGTVKGDLHDIGKNLVGMMLEGCGFSVIDLGTDVSLESFVEAVQEHGADILGLSALLTTTMANMRPVIEALENLGLREKLAIIVGGAPVTEQFATSVGADGTAPDASKAASLAKRLLTNR